MTVPSSSSSISSCRIFWSTQSGRAKACARRTARILGESTMLKLDGGIGSPFDEAPVPFLELLSSPPSDDTLNNGNKLVLMFVSTTGDGEQCDSIQNTWKSLLQKSIPKNFLAGSKYEFALFCLGDRAYGHQFCAAGRKLAVRLLQLGLPRFCEVGYGDDNTPNGGVFRDLDDWLERLLLPKVLESSSLLTQCDKSSALEHSTSSCPYRVEVIGESTASNTNGRTLHHNNTSTLGHDVKEEQQKGGEMELEFLEDSYLDYFTDRGPITAYSYDASRSERTANSSQGATKSRPLLGTVVMNERITDTEWRQNTRHVEIDLGHSDSQSEGIEWNSTIDIKPKENGVISKGKTPQLPYLAGDVASVLPFNSSVKVNEFLSLLPDSISSIADCVIRIELEESLATDNRYTRWPDRCTVRGWLTYCADIQSLPEREDLRALSAYCAPRNNQVKDSSLDQSEKLRSFSETTGAALYADYILREKRSWIDVLHDFESLREPGSRLTIDALLTILPPMRTRDFSIASAPSMAMIRNKWKGNGADLTRLFSIELCVAVVEGKTRLGRSYHGLCSKFLSQTHPSSELLIWIRPGTFGKMPRQLAFKIPSSFEVPIICVGAGTGIAPMRSLILERVAVKYLARKREAEESIADESKTKSEDLTMGSASSMYENDNILVFGSRKRNADYYYEKEWETLKQENSIRLLTAFSQDQLQKIYVQKILRDADDGALISKHILERGGAIYIAGNPKMARAVKQEITEVLSNALPGGEEQTKKLLNKMHRMGRFSIEAWN